MLSGAHAPHPAGPTGHPTPPSATTWTRWRRVGDVAVVAAVMGGSLAVPLAGRAMASSTPSKPKAVVVKTASRAGLGTVLVTGSGATLYRYTPDPPGKVTCTGGCATEWPPLTVPAKTTSVKVAKGLSGFGTVKMANGTRVVTYHKEPLYRFAGDKGSSANGQGIAGIWYVVHPTAKATGAVKKPATTTTTAGGSSGGSSGGYGGY